MHGNILDSIGFVEQFDSEVAAMMGRELRRQRDGIELIASENFVTPAVMEAMGSPLTNKYAEGYPYVREMGNKGRYYGGTEFVDELEQVCIDRAKALFGAGGGVLFIPSHLVADVVEGAAKTHVKDDFGFEMISQNKFTTAQIDRNTWTVEMLDMLMDWIKTDPRGEAYRDLDWSKEYDLAINGDPNDTQTAL